MKIGIFGGTFDPIHVGHLIIMENALNFLSLDKIIVLPTSNPPHKLNNKKTDYRLRIEMVKKAVSNNPRIEISTYESESMKVNYTYETMRYFREKYKDDKVYCIIGEDSLRDIETWKNFEDFLKENSIIVFSRFKDDGSILKKVEKFKHKIKEIIVLDNITTSISSTIIRKMKKDKLSIKYLVPENVEKMILERHLYE